MTTTKTFQECFFLFVFLRRINDHMGPYWWSDLHEKKMKFINFQISWIPRFWQPFRLYFIWSTVELLVCRMLFSEISYLAGVFFPSVVQFSVHHIHFVRAPWPKLVHGYFHQILNYFSCQSLLWIHLRNTHLAIQSVCRFHHVHLSFAKPFNNKSVCSICPFISRIS